MTERLPFTIGTILTILFYTVSVVVWGIRQEGRIETLELERVQLEKRVDAVEETGSKQSRQQIAVLDQKVAEILKGFTPYGVENLQKEVKDIEVNRAAVVAEFEARLGKVEEEVAKLPVLEQRITVIDEKGPKDMPRIEQRLAQLEILLDNLSGRQTPVTKRVYEDRW